MKRKNDQTPVIELDESAEESDGSGLNSSDIICTYHEDNSFIIDTEQCDEQENSAFTSSEAGSKLDMSNICSHFTPEVKKTKKGPTCFNCQGEHQLSECTEPRDNRRISRNRSSFRSNQGGPRIHEQIEKDKKAFVPGIISDSLREALGIRKNDIPEWIFRMRAKGFIDGYPPAYLKRAVEKSTLDFFATERVVGPDDDKTKEMIDPEKMIRYRGFNQEDKKLNDPEKFRIPPWKDFVAAHQYELDKRNEIRHRMDQRRASLKSFHPSSSKKKRKLNASIEEGEIVDESFSDQATETKSDIINETSDIPSNYDSENSGHKDEEHSFSTAGPGVTKGTPILISSSICSGQLNHEVVKPSLESWTHNILPFQHQNIVEETGFFKKMLSIVKEARKKSGM